SPGRRSIKSAAALLTALGEVLGRLDPLAGHRLVNVGKPIAEVKSSRRSPPEINTNDSFRRRSARWASDSLWHGNPRKELIFGLFVSQGLFELPILLERGFALLDEDRKSLFMTWLGEHGSSVMKVARAYTLTSEECQDLAQEILLQAWRS